MVTMCNQRQNQRSLLLRVLLVGDQEEDFFLIRDMLERNRSLIAAELEPALSKKRGN